MLQRGWVKDNCWALSQMEKEYSQKKEEEGEIEKWKQKVKKRETIQGSVSSKKKQSKSRLEDRENRDKKAEKRKK